MILFQDCREKRDKVPSKNLDGFKDIRTVESISAEKQRDFWDEFFGKTDIYVPDKDKNYFPEIFGRNIDEFYFNFEISQTLRENLKSFNADKWSNMDESEQVEIITKFSTGLSEKIGLLNLPTVTFFTGPKESCGAYNSETNVITINRALFDDPAEVVDTIAHETWHAYQHQRALILENKHDYLYKLNFENYISPTPLGDGKYLFFTDYQEQLVEAEARAFANIFREEVAS